MIRYAAVALALLALVGCRGKEVREETPPAAPPVEHGYAEEERVWGDDKAEPRYQYRDLAAYWPAVEYVYAGEWGSTGCGKGEFRYPGDIAVAPDGTVYVVDYFNHRVQYFRPRAAGEPGEATPAEARRRH
jgi:hypothetical protein